MLNLENSPGRHSTALSALRKLVIELSQTVLRWKDWLTKKLVFTAPSLISWDVM